MFLLDIGEFLDVPVRNDFIEDELQEPFLSGRSERAFEPPVQPDIGVASEFEVGRREDGF